ncbi:tRNA(adenine34) deaminase [Mitosporidium daphniae]|uniref:CMP/dCMP-type deaminase domain-containing protein n=1 Tax=Mitosporidium daphniae TaxID=1485682 RepID=A0A098VTM7_9MICR|nr:uncharacterized protein DI09_18p230 [Mitosporidium daphniae]KGG52317.1 hypothetical protein DI09_18p230 [Mitosporidium daphniae]|eukprot:XP_013238744.1 uncharacterized protein DI09_18p230 [Mitosporidium daphniae]
MDVNDDDVEIMSHAFALAEQAYENLEVPIGCVIVCPVAKFPSLLPSNGRTLEAVCKNTLLIIGAGRNNTMASCNATRHAEIEAIDQITKSFCDTIPWHQCSLYVTVEPCIMCIAALTDLGKFCRPNSLCLGIKEIIFGCHNDRFGGCGSAMKLPSSYSDNPPITIRHGVSAKEAITLLRRFYIRENKSAPKPRKKDNRTLKDCF